MSNLGVALFNLSRLDDAVAALEHGLELLELAGDEAGILATSSFLCIANPADPRVPGWLARALESADAWGDRAKQVSTLVALMWNRFFTSFCGNADEVAAAEAFAWRTADLAEDFGMNDTVVHARSLLVVMARMSGRLDDMADEAAMLQRSLGSVRGADAWLGWAASYLAALAGGASSATPPFPPGESTEPIVSMARLVIEAGLILAGRADDALVHYERPLHQDLGVISELLGLFHGLAMLLCGREQEAESVLLRAHAAAVQLGAVAAATGAAALLAAIRHDPAGLPPQPAATRSLVDVLIRFAHARSSGSQADPELDAAVAAIAAPGLRLLAPSSPR